MRYGDSVLILNVVNNVVLFENDAGTKLETRGRTDAPPKQEIFTIESDIYPIGTPIHFQDNIELVTQSGTHLTVNAQCDQSIQHASTLFNIIDVNDPTNASEVTPEHLFALVTIDHTLLAVENDLTVSIHSFEAQNHQEEFRFIVQRETILVAARDENKSSVIEPTIQSKKESYDLSFAPRKYHAKAVSVAPTESLLNLHVQQKNGVFDSYIKVPSTMTVQEFKTIVETMSSIPADKMRILARGRFLKDESTFKENHIRSNEYVFLVANTIESESTQIKVPDENENIAQVIIKTLLDKNSPPEPSAPVLGKDTEEIQKPEQEPEPLILPGNLMEYERALESLLNTYQYNETSITYKEMVEVCKAIYREQLVYGIVTVLPEGIDLSYKQLVRREVMKLAMYYVNEEKSPTENKKKPERKPVDKEIWRDVDCKHRFQFSSASVLNNTTEITLKKSVNNTTEVSYTYYTSDEWKQGIEVFDDNIGITPIWWISEHDSDTIIIQCIKDKTQPVKVCTHKYALTRWVTWRYFMDQDNRNDNSLTALGKYGESFCIFYDSKFVGMIDKNNGITFNENETESDEIRNHVLLFCLALMLKSHEKMNKPLSKILQNLDFTSSI
jgi:hypothetical protein